MENYKVNYAFDPNNKLEMEYSNEKAEEVCPSKLIFLSKDVQSHNGNTFTGHTGPRTWKLD
jgi:hypothetical protein